MAKFYDFNDGKNDLTINLECITHLEKHDQLSTKVYLVSGEEVIVYKEYGIVKQLIMREMSK